MGDCERKEHYVKGWIICAAQKQQKKNDKDMGYKIEKDSPTHLDKRRTKIPLQTKSDAVL